MDTATVTDIKRTDTAGRGESGWRVQTDIDMGEIIDNVYKQPGRRILRIQTSKNGLRGTLETSAYSFVEVGRSQVHAMFSEYNVRLVSTKARVTEKSVKAQHAAALAESLDKVISDCKAHYKTA